MQNIVFFNIFLTLVKFINSKDPQFYEFELHNIEEYDDEMFSRNILNSNRATFVEFYAHWCGSSKNFKQKWKQFANETKGWHKHVLRVAAIDCERNITNLICDLNEINDYPQFKLYFARTTNIRGTGKEGEKSKIENFMRSTIDFLEKQRHPPREWPTLFPYT